MAPLPVDMRLLDDAGPAFSLSGEGWQGVSQPAAYHGGSHSHAADPADTATWAFGNLKPAERYEVFATWLPSDGQANDAPYTIFDGANEAGTVRVNQQAAPSDWTYLGRTWQSLGLFTVQSGALDVQLSDDANGSVSADAVRVVREGTVDSLLGRRAASGDSITLTAQTSDPDHHVNYMAFYYDSNHSGKMEPASDQLLGIDADGSDGWSFQVPTDSLSQEFNVFFARTSLPSGPVNWATAVVQVTAAADSSAVVQQSSDSAVAAWENTASTADRFYADGFYMDDSLLVVLGSTVTGSVYFWDSDGSQWLVTVDYGDGGTDQPSVYWDNNRSCWAFDVSHEYPADGDFTLAATVESEFDTASSSSQVAVGENSRVDTFGHALRGSSYFISSSPTEMSVSVDYGDGSSENLPYYGNSADSYWISPLNHNYGPGSDSFTLTVTVHDQYGDSASGQLPGFSQDATYAGDEFRASGYFYLSPPGWSYQDDYWGYHATQWGTVDYGDGSRDVVELTWGSGGENAWFYSVSHQYNDPGQYTLTVHFQNDHGQQGTNTSIVTVVDAPPSMDGLELSAGGSYTVSEVPYEPIVLLEPSVTGDWGDGVSFAWDFNGDGGYGNDPGEAPVPYDPQTGDGPYSYFDSRHRSQMSLSVVAYDSAGHTAFASAEISSSYNEPPTVWSDGSYTVPPGGAVTLWSWATDWGDDFDDASFQWDLDGDGVYGETGAAAPFGDEVGPAPRFWATNLPRSYPLTLPVRVTDAWGAVTDGTPPTVTLQGETPTVEIGGPYTGNEGASVPLSAILSTGSNTSWYFPSVAWDLNDDGLYGNDSGELGQSVVFPAGHQTGVYPISVLATDTAGHRARAFGTV